MMAKRGERWLVLVLTLLSFLYFSHFAFRGWIAHDEGTLAQSAERILAGEMPHRDFDEVYTGGLSYLHAAAFRVLGTRLRSMRWLLLLCGALWTPAVYLLARRVIGIAGAIAVTAMCVVWTLPNYFAGVPSWYGLFLATFGVLGLARFFDSGRRAWLMVAGFCGGLSLLIKVVALYYVLGAILVLLYCEQLTSTEGSTNANRSIAFASIKALALAMVPCGMLLLISRHLMLMEVLHFVVPAVFICAYLVRAEIAGIPGSFAARSLAFGRLVVPFAAGCLVPPALFVLWYWNAGALRPLYDGLFVLPLKRLDAASLALPPADTLVWVLPLALLVFGSGALRDRPWVRRLITFPTPLLAGAVLGWILAVGNRISVYQRVWFSVRPVVPVASIAACLLLVGIGLEAEVSRSHRAGLFLMAVMAYVTSLIQYPYAYGIYFCYAAPFAILALLYVIQAQPRAVVPVYACAAAFYFFFAAVWLNTGSIRWIGVEYRKREADTLLAGKAQIWVDRNAHDLYELLVRAVRERTEPGSYIYAAPDCPQMYFLTGMRNPTRTLYDFLDSEPDRAATIPELLRRRGVKVVILNTAPEFSPEVREDLLRALEQMFPYGAPVAWFRLLWRD